CVLNVSCVWFEPSAFITQIWRTPVRSLVKAILLPLGDQTGSPLKPGAVVSWCSWLPSGLITQTSVLPVRSLSKAILFVCPQEGSPSNEVLNVSWCRWLPFASITNTSESFCLDCARLVSNAMCLPFGDQVGLRSIACVCVRRVGLPPFELTP